VIFLRNAVAGAMVKREYNLNLCLAIGLCAVLLTLVLGALQKQAGVFDGADAAAIRVAKELRFSSLLTSAMRGLTFFGDEMGVTIVICVLYWLGYSTETAGFLVALLFGAIINDRMKDFFELSRPPEHEIEWLSHADGYGYPSGHSHVGMLYSWLIYVLVGKYWYLCLLVALLMAATRIYLGVHYFSDTVGGMLCGFGVAVAATGIYAHIRGLGALRQAIRSSLALKVGLSLSLSTAYLILAWGLSGDFKYAGLLAGFFIVYTTLDFRWRARGPLSISIAIAVGLSFLLAVRGGLKEILPAGQVSDYARYFLTGVLLAGSPFAFVKMRLLEKVEETGQDGERPNEYGPG